MRYLRLGLLCITLQFINIYTDPGMKLNYNQAQETAKMIISALLSPENHLGTYGKELSNFTERSTYNVLEKIGTSPNFWSFSKVYDYTQLYNGIISEIIQFIKQKTMDYAQEDIINFHIPLKFNTKELIINITKSISEDILKIVMQPGSLPQGALDRYVGVFLKHKVHKMILKELKENLTLDADYNCDVCQICPRCSGYFNNLSRRIILPCGHSICQKCLKQEYSDNQLNCTCYNCKSIIKNIKLLIEEINNQSVKKSYLTYKRLILSLL